MAHKLKGRLFTVNLTFLLIFNLFLIILVVLSLTAGGDGWPPWWQARNGGRNREFFFP